MNTVLYRKWRPQHLGQVVGQEGVTKTLHNAVSLGRVAHAYLFCGPRGTGKTSTARILAKTINCLAPKENEPDNTCESCLSINEARSLDLIEIDAASNRGIDDIRSLRDKIHYTPNNARYKVYIVDEVHMLTEAAFSALLKTLEEPPSHAIFVLATTEAHKVPLTIISRCQRFDFRRIPVNTIIDRLAYLCTKEKVEATPGALRLIAISSGGSLRDADNLLEQAIVSYGSHLGEENARDLLEMDNDERAVELVEHIMISSVQDGLTVINEIAAQGSDLRQFHRVVIECLRSLMLLKSGAEPTMSYSEEVTRHLQSLANATTLEHLVRALKVFSQADLRRDSSSPLPLELALIQSCPLPDSMGTSHASIIEPQGLSHSKTSQPSKASSQLTKPLIQTSEKETLSDSTIEPQNLSHPKTGQPSKASSQLTNPLTQTSDVVRIEDSPTSNFVLGKPSDHTSKQSELLEMQWPTVLNSLRRYKGKRFNLSALLRDCKEREITDGEITLKFSYRSHMERMEDELEDPQVRRVLQQTFAKILDNTYDVSISLINETSDSRRRNPSQTSHLVRAAQAMGARIVGEREEKREQENVTPGTTAPKADT